MADEYEEARRAALKQQVEARLRHLCSHFPADEFDKMVDKIVETQIRGEGRSASWGRIAVNLDEPPIARARK